VSGWEIGAERADRTSVSKRLAKRGVGCRTSTPAPLPRSGSGAVSRGYKNTYELCAEFLHSLSTYMLFCHEGDSCL